MPDSDDLWNFYWEVRLREMEDMGKREAILAVSQLIRRLADESGQPLRLLELGCGEGQIIGSLLDAHAQALSLEECCAVDYSSRAVEICRRSHPRLACIQGDFTDPALLSGLGQFEIVLLVNSLHEVFTAGLLPMLDEVAILESRQRVRLALAGAVQCVAPGGWLVLFDGLEPTGDPQSMVRIRFHHWQARRRFDLFASQYQPFRISFTETGDPLCVELWQRDFTRYITKSIFLEKRLWQTERLESYQYFTREDFINEYDNLGLALEELRTLTVNYEKWRSEVEIESPGVDFPTEHILILAQKPSGGPGRL